MKKLAKGIKYILELLFIAFPALVFALFSKIFIWDLWLISETGFTARDNGYHFFKWLRENHPKQNIVFVINKNSPDYEKIHKLGKTCNFGGFKHWYYYFLCSKEISTHPHYKPGHYINKNFWFNKTYFLQHGVIKNYHAGYDAKHMKFKLFVVSAEKEKNLIDGKYGFKKEVTKLTGLARFDSLINSKVDYNQILVMPTWRKYLTNLSKEEFVKSNYFLHWSNFLNSKEFLNLLKENNKTIVFYPHIMMQKYLSLFDIKNPFVKVLGANDADVHELLKSSSMLITDFSSVHFDMAYMKKPVIWYTFDFDDFYSKQQEYGYFNEKNDFLGKHADSQEEVLYLLNHFIKKNFKLSNKEEKDIDNFFTYFDCNNCERIYNAIKGIKHEKK